MARTASQLLRKRGVKRGVPLNNTSPRRFKQLRAYSDFSSSDASSEKSRPRLSTADPRYAVAFQWAGYPRPGSDDRSSLSSASDSDSDASNAHSRSSISGSSMSGSSRSSASDDDTVSTPGSSTFGTHSTFASIHDDDDDSQVNVDVDVDMDLLQDGLAATNTIPSASTTSVSSDSSKKKPPATKTKSRATPPKNNENVPDNVPETTDDNDEVVVASDAPEDFISIPYVLTCFAITVHGTRCTRRLDTTGVPENELPSKCYCSIHERLPKVHGTLLDPSTIPNVIRRASQHACTAITKLTGEKCTLFTVHPSHFCWRHIKHPPSHWIPPYPVEPPTPEGDPNRPKDSYFRGKANHERCVFINSNGKPCPYNAVNDTICCNEHAEWISKWAKMAPSRAVVSSSWDDSDDEEEDGDDDPASDKDPHRPYRYNEFLQLWKECEEFLGETTDDIESSRRVRSANQAMCPGDTDGQTKAQYGRILPKAMKTMLNKILCLSHNDVFLDIGHGIGNTCLQAAFTTGCEARGIEVVFGRNSIAEVFRDTMVNLNQSHVTPRMVGKVTLLHGRLEEPQFRDYLTKGVTRAYVNNFNGVFAERSAKNKQRWFLDDYVSGLFCLMAPGTILVTLHPLGLGPTREEANDSRRRHNLSESPNASFFSVEKLLLGKACDTVKWNQHSGNARNIYVYKYTRLTQPLGPDAVFMCCNPSCRVAQKNKTIPAATINEEGRVVLNHCICKFTPKTIRRQPKKSYKAM
eukprot:Nitzschia sp. Nitz4//scaffold267_size26297//22673//25031//NITZ4_008273-RA/size26297-augustus-gene-0.21-mRNA-1//-1//CDS//3329544917//2484//frame0